METFASEYIYLLGRRGKQICNLVTIWNRVWNLFQIFFLVYADVQSSKYKLKILNVYNDEQIFDTLQQWMMKKGVKLCVNKSENKVISLDYYQRLNVIYVIVVFV